MAGDESEMAALEMPTTWSLDKHSDANVKLEEGQIRLPPETKVQHEMTIIQYMKTRSRATMKGEWYEVKVAALLYLRSKNSARVVHFQLTTNVDGAGALDDIVHRAKYTDNPNTWYTSFIQLKHKEKAMLGVSRFTGQKGDFSLMKYFDSFSEIKKAHQENVCKNMFLFDGSFDYFNFVIYTNSQVERRENVELNQFVSTSGKSFLEKLLKSNSDKEMIFKFNNVKNRDVFEFMKADETPYASEFLEKLTVFSGQPSESELDDVIKKELLIACKGKVSDAEPVYRIFEGLFKQWWRDSNIVLDETSDILQKAIDQLSGEARLTNQTEQCTLDITFDETLWTSFHTGFSGGVSLLHVVTTGGCLRQSATKVLRLLHTERLSFTFISLKYLLQHKQKLIRDWRDGYKDCLVVVCESDESKVEDDPANISNDIKEVLERKPNKKAVLVSHQNCQLANELQKSNIFSYKTINDIFDLTHLDEACKKKILGSKVSFQDYSIAFKSLYDRDSKFWDTLLCDNLLKSLLAEHLLTIGEKLPCVVQHYIPRRLKRCNVLSPDIFVPGNFKELIAVSAVTNELDRFKDRWKIKYLSKNSSAIRESILSVFDKMLPASFWLNLPNDKRDKKGWDPASIILLLDNIKAAEEFNAICRLKPTVHWIHIEDGVLKWITTKGKISQIKQFVDETLQSVVQSDSIMASDSRADLIIAEPGMGKTTLMPTLAQTAKSSNPADWVILLNLRDHSELFNRFPQLSALDFIMSALRIDSPLERAFLQVSLEQTGNIVVVLDSFDEICPRYEQEGCGLLTSILETRVKKVVVSSRHCMQDMLENLLSTLAYNIIEFSEEDQKRFFHNVWSKSSSPMTPQQLEVFITTLIDRVNAIDRQQRLMGIPLQTMILAEIFNDHVMDPEHNEFPQKLDMIYLFEQFVEKKFTIFFSKGNNNLNKEDSRKRFLLDHMHAALKLLVHEKDIHKLHSDHNFTADADILLKNMKEAKDNSGLVISVQNKKPIFIHQMFAEYLAGRWFAEHFHWNKDFLKDNLFKRNYNVIRIMFDRILSKGHRLHEAVLDMDMARLETMLAVEGADANARDLGGRSALHLAAAVGFEFHFINNYETEGDTYVLAKVGTKYQFEKCKPRTDCPRPRHMVELLIEHVTNANVTDTVLMWNPLQYALETKTWDAMEYLLASRADSSNLVVSSLMKNHLLASICMYGFSNILTLFLQQGLPIEFKVKFHTPLLHFASRYGQVECVKLLLSRGANKRAVDNDEDASLHVASKFGHLSVVRSLIEDTNTSTISMFLHSKHKSNFLCKYVNIRNKHGQSALHIAMTSEICLLLISHGADLWSRDYSMRTCLHTASFGKLSLVQTMIASLGPNSDKKTKFVNAVDVNNDSAILNASKSNHTDIVRLLISHGADVWSRDKKGKTCLHSAGSDEVARAIIESLGDDKDVKNYVNLLDNEGVSALVEASRSGRIDVFDLLILYGADLRSRDQQGRNCLYDIRSGGVSEVLKSLGDDKDEVCKIINTTDNEGVSVLAEASRSGYREVVDLFISHGADVTSRDKRGRTSLHAAAERLSLSVAQALIGSLGDDKAAIVDFINIRDEDGRTAQEVALRTPYGSNRSDFMDWLDTILRHNKKGPGFQSWRMIQFNCTLSSFNQNQQITSVQYIKNE